MMGVRTSDETRALVEALSRAGLLSQKEIAARCKVCIDMVRAVEKSIGLQRQPAKRTRGRLSDTEKKKIAKLYCDEGQTVTDICKRLRLGRNTVAAHIKRMGLVAGLPARKMLALRRVGLSQRRIAAKLRLNYRAVFRWFRAHGYTRQRYRLTAAQILNIDSAILRRDGSAAAIAGRFDAPYHFVLKRAHQLLECERFLSTWKTPLESYLPSLRPLPAIKRGEMPAQRFVETFFQFEPRAGVVITDADVTLAAKILLEARKLFFGAPQNEGQYLSELQHCVAAHLGLGYTTEWVH